MGGPGASRLIKRLFFCLVKEERALPLLSPAGAKKGVLGAALDVAWSGVNRF